MKIFNWYIGVPSDTGVLPYYIPDPVLIGRFSGTSQNLVLKSFIIRKNNTINVVVL